MTGRRGRLLALLAILVPMALAACTDAPARAPASARASQARTSRPPSPIASISAPTLVSTEAEVEPTAQVEWTTYRNNVFGFSFQYPSAYDAPGNAPRCGIRVEQQADRAVVRWGMRSTLEVSPSDGGTPDDLLQSRLGQDATNVEVKDFAVGGAAGVWATFRFGGPNRFGEIYAFKHQGYDYVATFTAGAMCEPQGLSLLEPAAFDHAVQSLSFQP